MGFHTGDVVFLFVSSRRRHTICAVVTGVQTCALPISCDDRRGPKKVSPVALAAGPPLMIVHREASDRSNCSFFRSSSPSTRGHAAGSRPHAKIFARSPSPRPRASFSLSTRSDERRVGKDGVTTCRSRGSPHQLKKNN